MIAVPAWLAALGWRGAALGLFALAGVGGTIWQSVRVIDLLGDVKAATDAASACANAAVTADRDAALHLTELQRRWSAQASAAAVAESAIRTRHRTALEAIYAAPTADDAPCAPVLCRVLDRLRREAAAGAAVGARDP